MTYSQAMVQQDSTAEDFVVELKAKPTQELGRFMAGPWTASLLLPEEIEELYQELQSKEASPRYATEEDLGMMGQD